MLVGFMSRYKKPPEIAKVTALMCTHYNIKLIYVRPWDVDMEKGVVTGKMFENNKWIQKRKPLPVIIDASTGCFRKDVRHIMHYLRKNTILTFDKKNTPNKEKLQQELLKDSNFSSLVIPTERMNSFETLEEFLNLYTSIIMKPLYGNRGRGIHSLRKKGETYILGYREKERQLNHEELLEYYSEHLTDEKYILQKFIDSRTKSGDPFDCRVHVQKGRNGKWDIARIFVRIGIGQKVMSNVHQGGGISDPIPFLKANFESLWEETYEKLEDLAFTLPYKIEEIKKTATMDLGFDIGIEKSGELFLFESNNGATVKPLISESAMLRVDYYQFIRDLHPEFKKREVKELYESKAELRKKVKSLQKTNQNLLEEKYKITSSRSWRIMSPIRKIKFFLKR